MPLQGSKAPTKFSPRPQANQEVDGELLERWSGQQSRTHPDLGEEIIDVLCIFQYMLNLPRIIKVFLFVFQYIEFIYPYHILFNNEGSIRLPRNI